MDPSNDTIEQQPTHKTMLYCSACDHASRINGDWILYVYPEYLDYECPECGTTIDSRRDGVALTDRSRGTLGVSDAD